MNEEYVYPCQECGDITTMSHGFVFWLNPFMPRLHCYQCPVDLDHVKQIHNAGMQIRVGHVYQEIHQIPESVFGKSDLQ